LCEENEVYTNDLGQIKVKFNWDRYTEDSEHTSCWLRVSQQLADENWGLQFLPRVGSEVIIDFLNGDPDRPIVTGSIYNAAQLPPYQYPNAQNLTGIKTPQNNEIQFNDTKNAEELNIHAAKDYEATINKSKIVNIGQNLTEQIGGDQSISTQKEFTIIANKQITLNAGAGSIIMKPDSITFQAPKISLG